MRPAPSACLVGLAILVATGGSARAQLESREAISLQNQILELRHELEQSQNAGGAPVAPPVSGRGGSPGDQSGAGGDPTGLTPQLLDRVQTLEGQVRDLRGELDQLSNQVQQQNAALSKQVGDLGFAVQQAHGGVGAASPPAGGAPSQELDADPGADQGGAPGSAPGVPASAGRPQVPAPPVHRTPEATLAAGNAAVARRDYAGAEADARSVLAGPRSPRQVDAQFLLGQSLAGQRQYQQAAVAYYDAYNRSPRSGRAPDALLGVSASLLAVGDKPSACQALAKLHAEFPSPAPRARNAYFALRGRAGCR